MSNTHSAPQFARDLARSIIKPLPNNFVERPWGGTRIRQFKNLCALPDQRVIGGAGLGESFEIAAFDGDPEACRFPSMVRLANGELASLPALLEAHGELILGKEWVSRHGRCIPLLPKFLCVAELLSIQGHPPGHTEVYVTVDDDPGATIRVGFRRNMDRQLLQRELNAGLDAQRQFAAMLNPETDWLVIQHQLGSWFAARDKPVAEVLDALGEHLIVAGQTRSARRLLETLKNQYWFMLDAMNEIELRPGQIIHNCNPPRFEANLGHAPAAEVHALGNPEGREFVMLEVRRPGPTLRAWDNVRFPMREVDIEGALDVLNLEATSAEEFIVTPAATGDPTRQISVDSPNFRLEHIKLEPAESLVITSAATHCLHVLEGAALVSSEYSDIDASLERGESAIVPEQVDVYSIASGSVPIHIVKVDIP